MRKLLSVISIVLIMAINILTPVYGASVEPKTIPGNDSNPNDYSPPEGCIHYEIPNSEDEGTHTVTFNELGEVDPQGEFSFTVVVGQDTGESFTKVLSWSSNFPIHAVIVKGGDAFNLYQYEPTVREDTDLVSPDNPSGDPADVSHVSIVICPDQFPPTPTDTPCPTCPPDPTPCPPCPPSEKCLINIIVVVFVMFIIVFFLLGLLLGTSYLCPKKKSCTKNEDYDKNEYKGKKPYKGYKKTENYDNYTDY